MTLITFFFSATGLRIKTQNFKINKIANWRFTQITYSIIFFMWTLITFMFNNEYSKVKITKQFCYDESNEIFFFVKKNFFVSFSMNSFSFFFIFMTNAIIMVTLCTYLESKVDFSWKPMKFIYELKKQEWTNNLFCIIITSLTLILYVLFTTSNLIVFFIFFELSIVPLISLIIFFSKRSQKFRAKNYLVFFTLFSGIPFFIAVLWLWGTTNSLEIFTMSKNINFMIIHNKISTVQIIFAFMAFFIPFIVKGAIFPFHGWLPEAHVEASTEGSILLSGILLKVGFFGLVKFTNIFFFPVYFLLSNYMVPFFIITLIFPTSSLFIMNDSKKVIAYYSIIHMHMGIIGALCGNSLALEGSIYINFTHALTSAGLFASMGYLFDKMKTRYFSELAGLDLVIPRWSINIFVLLLSNAAIPGTIGFIPEIAVYAGVIVIFPYETFFLFFVTNLAAVRSFILFNQLSFSNSFQNNYSNKLFNKRNQSNIAVFTAKYMNCASFELLSVTWLSYFCFIFGLWGTKIINLIPKFF
jgi:NADH:ubiquinone oxidoreductase subunit 4 (subunit M)